MIVCRADNSLLKYFAERRFHCIVLPYQNMKLCVMQKPVDVHRISNIATGMKNIEVPALLKSVKCFKVHCSYNLNVLALYESFSVRFCVAVFVLFFSAVAIWKVDTSLCKHWLGDDLHQ